jgi:hypothetical protein
MNLTISEQAGGGTGISWYYRSESGKWRVGVSHPQRRVWLSRSDDYSVILPYDDSDPLFLVYLLDLLSRFLSCFPEDTSTAEIRDALLPHVRPGPCNYNRPLLDFLSQDYHCNQLELEL